MALDLLSEKELCDITGATQHTKQADVLDRNGIYYIKRLDGSIVTTLHHVNNPCKRAIVSNDSIPDFGAIANG